MRIDSSTAGQGVLSAAVGGVRRSMDRFNKAGTRIIAQEGDLTANAIDMKLAEVQVKANVAVLKAAQDMEDSILDILV